MKIFISYHQLSQVLKSEILTPIIVGAESFKKDTNKLKDFIYDNIGENISSKNDRYCELTAQYWAWKNVKEDYIGFLHYRRHFDFSGIVKDENLYGLEEYDSIDLNYVLNYGLVDSSIKKVVEDHDVVLPNAWDVRNVGSKNNYDHYAKEEKLFISHLDTVINIIHQKYPEFSASANEYLQSPFGYYTNMFVMKWEIFDDYCNFLFSILSEAESQINTENLNFQQKRVFGYLSEWLFGIYITHLKKNSCVTFIELPRTFIRNPQKKKTQFPICYCADSNYFYPLSVSITSVIKNAKDPSKLIFYIVDGGLKSKEKKDLEEFIKKNGSFVSFTHFNSKLINSLSSTVEKTHLSLSAYLRIFIPQLLPSQVSEALYLDCDTIVNVPLDDKIQEEKLFKKPINAVQDILHISNEKRLGLQKYINSGVLFLKCELLRERINVEKINNVLINQKDKLKYHDQDAINLAYEDQIELIDKRWNAQTSSYPGCEEQNIIGKCAFILHFISNRKPWIEGSNSPFQKHFDFYADLSPFGRLPLRRRKFSIKATKTYQLLSLLAYRTLPREGLAFRSLRKIKQLLLD